MGGTQAVGGLSKDRHELLTEPETWPVRVHLRATMSPRHPLLLPSTSEGACG